jgi:hypothetical protein
MASGHVNRTYRPNTWQHRPSLQREESPCQLGAVHTWHEADMPTASRNVRYWVNSGKHLLSLSFSGFDPQRTWRPPKILHSTGPKGLRATNVRSLGKS